MKDEIVILCLSDLHIRNNDSCFDLYENHFSMKLKELEESWKPHFLCITGDIIHQGKPDSFNRAERFIDKVLKNLDLTRQNVLLAPGNHDMYMVEIRNDSKKRKAYFKSLNSFLKNINENEYRNNIEQYFKNYINFRNKFTNDIDDNNYPQDLQFLKPLVQYKKFDKEKIVFWELNNTWYSVPLKRYDKQNKMEFGLDIIESFKNRIEKLKEEGNFIVTLFHQPFRKIDESEYKIYENRPCVYDEILELSDVCVAGHEHGVGKAPDFLGNLCQYFSAGIFYPKGEISPTFNSSAILLKINQKNNKIIRKELVFENGKYGLKDNNNDPVFPIHPDYPSKEGFDVNTIDFYLKKLPYSYHIGDSEELYRKIVLNVFGKEFKFDAGKNILMNKDSQVLALLFFEYLTKENAPKINFDRNTGITIVFFLVPDNKYRDRAEAEEMVREWTERYRGDFMKGNLATFLIFLC